MRGAERRGRVVMCLNGEGRKAVHQGRYGIAETGWTSMTHVGGFWSLRAAG